MLKKLLKLIIVLVLIMAAALTAAVFLVAEDYALVARTATPSESEIAELRKIISENKPAQVLKSGKKTLVLTTSQINQLMSYASYRLNPSLSANMVTDRDRFYLRSSFRLPDNPLGQFLNISVKARVQLAKYLVIEELKLGQLRVPPVLVTIVEPYMLEQLNSRYAEYIALWKYLRRIDLRKEKVTVYYRLERSDLAQIKKLGRKVLVNSESRKKVLAYTTELENILSRMPDTRQSLIHLLVPMFDFARAQSVKSQEPVEENRMALLVLGSYMTGRNPAKYISDEAVKPFKKIKFTLKERTDLSQHYLVSSAINALSGTAWSNAIGLEKELNDADGGSGFSFVDLMADIAGNKLAQAALNKASAANLQEKMTSLQNESEIIGRIEGLQEGLTEREFKLEYGNANSDEYMTVVREIERRLFRSTAYR